MTHHEIQDELRRGARALGSSGALFLTSALTLSLPLVLSLACKEGTTITGPDVGTATDTGIPGDWSEPVRVEAGSEVLVYSLFDAVGYRFIFEIDWESAANDVSLVVYEEELGVDGNSLCTIPGFDFGTALPVCPVKVSREGPEKPKRVEWEGDAGLAYSIFAVNHGPGAANVRYREFFLD